MFKSEALNPSVFLNRVVFQDSVANPSIASVYMSKIIIKPIVLIKKPVTKGWSFWMTGGGQKGGQRIFGY
jgi:hypothetical protein